MGPSPESDGNDLFISSRQPEAKRLQWGRRPRATEIGLRKHEPTIFPRGFNGAVARERRKSPRRGGADVADRCFNGAVARERRKSRTAAAGRAPGASRFNGAVARERRKSCQHAERVGASDASMGPSPESDGNGKGRRAHATDCKGFNGAVARERRKSFFIAWHRRQQRLQWGRRPRATEIRKSSEAIQGYLQASMGPSPESDGNRRNNSPTNASARGFNGAVARERRKSRRPEITCTQRATGFNGAVARVRRKSEIALIHNLRDTASMGPSPESDGNPGDGRHMVFHSRMASMGPSPESDGNITSMKAHWGSDWLQWGRRPERRKSKICRENPARNGGFNGAVARERRKCICSPGCFPATNRFNGAVARERRKSPCWLNPTRGCSHSFNGAVARERRKS